MTSERVYNGHWIYFMGIVIAGIVGMGLLGVALSITEEPEIDENQVQDDISRTIHVYLEEGIVSSEYLKEELER